MPTKDSPQGKPDNATGRKPQHTQDVENKPANKPAPAASDKNNDGKPDKRQEAEKNKEGDQQ